MHRCIKIEKDTQIKHGCYSTCVKKNTVTLLSRVRISTQIHTSRHPIPVVFGTVHQMSRSCTHSTRLLTYRTFHKVPCETDQNTAMMTQCEWTCHRDERLSNHCLCNNDHWTLVSSATLSRKERERKIAWIWCICTHCRNVCCWSRKRKGARYMALTSLLQSTILSLNQGLLTWLRSLGVSVY